MSKLILHYEDTDTLEMLIRNLGDYLSSENSSRYGVDSITIYSPRDNSSQAYFKHNKSGSHTAKAWKSRTPKLTKKGK